MGRRIPTKESNMLVRINRGCRMKVGMVDNLLSISGEDLVSHGMPTVSATPTI